MIWSIMTRLWAGSSAGRVSRQPKWSYALCNTLISSTWWLKMQWHLSYWGNFKAVSSEVTKFIPRINVSGIYNLINWKIAIVHLCFRFAWFNFASPFCFLLFWLPWIDCSSHNDGTFCIMLCFHWSKNDKKSSGYYCRNAARRLCFFRDSFISVIRKPNNSWDFREYSEVTVVVWTSVSFRFW